MQAIRTLEVYRLEKKLSQEELANMIGVNRATYSRWVNEGRTPNKIWMYHIEKFLKKHKKL